MFCRVAGVRPRGSTCKVSLVALRIAYGIAFSQMYHRAWIDRLGSNSLGTLLLRTTFYGHDQLAYTMGVAVCATFGALFIFEPRTK